MILAAALCLGLCCLGLETWFAWVAFRRTSSVARRQKLGGGEVWVLMIDLPDASPDDTPVWFKALLRFLEEPDLLLVPRPDRFGMVALCIVKLSKKIFESTDPDTTHFINSKYSLFFSLFFPNRSQMWIWGTFGRLGLEEKGYSQTEIWIFFRNARDCWIKVDSWESASIVFCHLAALQFSSFP